MAKNHFPHYFLKEGMMIIFACIFCLSIFAQDIHYSQFFTSPTNLNPALTGAFDGSFRVGLNQKTQWWAISKPFVTFSGSFDAPIIKSNNRRDMMGAGITVNRDQAGDSKYTTFHVNLSFSYLKSLDKKNLHKLGFGFYAGYVQRSVNYAELFFDEQYQSGKFDPGNPISESFGKEKFHFFDFGVGLSWSYSPSKKSLYSAGISLGHLSRPNQTLYSANTRLNFKTTGHLSARFSIKKEFYLIPMFYATFQGKYREFILGSNIEYISKKNNYIETYSIGGGLFYRVGDALIVMGNIGWKNLRVGISYDVNLSSLTKASQARGGFEVSLLYIYSKPRIRRTGSEPCPFPIM